MTPSRSAISASVNPSSAANGPEAQGFEDDLQRLHEGADGDVEALRAELDRVQERIDVASLNSEEWNVLYRLRLQLEHDVARRAGEKGSRALPRVG